MVKIYLAVISVLLSSMACVSDDTIDNTLVNPSTVQHTYLALGDSYTIGERVPINERWPEQLVTELNTANPNLSFARPEIIARTGWRTDELLQAINAASLEETYDLVSLLIGVNNQYQRKSIEIYREEFRALLRIAIKKTGDDPPRVLVVSIPDYGFTPFGSSDRDRISRELDEYNAINLEISEELGVMYVSITDISRSEDPVLVAADNLHPSGVQYAAWVARILASDDFQIYLSNQAP